MQTLDNLLREFERLPLQLNQYWNEGIYKQDLDAMFSEIPIVMPAELKHYFRWHDGLSLPEYEIFPSGRILSLQACLDVYELYMDVDAEAREDGSPPKPSDPLDPFFITGADGIWDYRWFPLFEGERDTWIAFCGELEQEIAPIYHLYLPSDTEFYLAYDSFADLIRTTTEAFQTGAYYEAKPWRVKQRRHLLLPILEKYNPKRQSYLLRSVNNAQNIEQVIDLLTTDNTQVRFRAFRCIRLLGDETVVPSLVELLTDRQPILRRLAAETLGSLGYHSAAEPLLAAIHDRDEDVRRAVIGALGVLGDERSLAHLERLKSDSSAKIRTMAQWALEWIAHP